MRRIPSWPGTALLSLALAACGGGVRQPPATTTPQAPSKPEQGDLVGRSRANLIQNLGPVALEVREGEGLKLQWRGNRCVLDAYLYASESSREERVIHVDTRDRDGRDVDQAGCLDALVKR